MSGAVAGNSGHVIRICQTRWLAIVQRLPKMEAAAPVDVRRFNRGGCFVGRSEAGPS
jgi:hypothetical protein